MTRHIKTIHSILVLALAGITTAAQSPLTGFAGKTDPVTVGNIIAEAFVRADAEQKDHIYYSTSSLWTNCLEFAHNTSNSDLEKALTDKMIPYYKEKSNFLPHRYHVDYTIFGAVPLEIYILSRDKKALRLGLSYADNQWAMPDTTDSETMKLNPKVSPAQQMEYWKLGYSPQTRLWIDDMYMISLLQLQAYKATGEKKYLDRAAYE
ncbi:MAG: glycoside hydrolase family 88 protein, partial [Bacteroidales bacterium]|nr:glycoside hydrolase family 88 protein [Candidatus Cryptobacteroides onthequi]